MALPLSIAQLVDVAPADLAALAEAADLLCAQGQYAAAARAFGGLEALEPRRDFTLRRAEAELAGGDLAAARATLDRLLSAEAVIDATTVAGLRLRAKVRAAFDPAGAQRDRQLAERFGHPSSESWS